MSGAAAAPARAVPGNGGFGDGYDWAALVARMLALAALLAIWQWIPASIVPEYAVSRPGATFRALWAMLVDGSLVLNLAGSLKGLFLGIAIGAPVGIALALLLRVPILSWVLDPLVTLGNAIPKVALISFFILWLGLSSQAHLALVLSFVVFIFCYNTRQAIDEVDPHRLTMLRLAGASRLQVIRLLTFPSSIPYLLAAVRIAVPLAFAVQVFAELRVPVKYGMGCLLGKSAEGMDGAGTMSVLIVVAAVGYLFDIVIGKRLSNYAQRVGAAGTTL